MRLQASDTRHFSFFPLRVYPPRYDANPFAIAKNYALVKVTQGPKPMLVVNCRFGNRGLVRCTVMNPSKSSRWHVCFFRVLIHPKRGNGTDWVIPLPLETLHKRGRKVMIIFFKRRFKKSFTHSQTHLVPSPIFGAHCPVDLWRICFSLSDWRGLCETHTYHTTLPSLPVSLCNPLKLAAEKP